MLEEKRKKYRMANRLIFIIFAIVTLVAYFLPLGGNNVLTMEEAYKNLISGPAMVWYLFFAVLIALALFTWFQAGSGAHHRKSKDRTLDILGRIPSVACILYASGIVSWHFELLTLALIAFLILTLVLFVANNNIRDDDLVMDEKFWVRNPFSLFLAWSLYMLMNTIAMGWSESFSKELNAVILLVIFMGIVLLTANFNRNLGVPFLWLFILIFKQIQYVDSYMFRMVTWAGIGAMVFIIVFTARRDRYFQKFRKPVNRAMSKYNYGQESELEKLEDDLNEKLQTKPGGRITFR